MDIIQAPVLFLEATIITGNGDIFSSLMNFLVDEFAPRFESVLSG